MLNTSNLLNVLLKNLKKITAMVVDNASNIKNAVSLSDNQLITCHAHTLQLSVRDALNSQEDVVTLIGKCKELVRYFKQSSKALARLHSIQREKQLKHITFIQEV